MHAPLPVPPAQGQQLDRVTAATGVLFGPGGVGADMEWFDQAYLHRTGSMAASILSLAFLRRWPLQPTGRREFAAI
jgi:hypothetical protein